MAVRPTYQILASYYCLKVFGGGGGWLRAILGSNPTVSHQLELVGVVSWTWVGLGFDKR